MKTRVLDLNALGALRPLEIATYLRSRAWVEQAAAFGDALVWVSPNGEYEVLLPLARRTPDFILRVSDLLTTLAVYEERPETDLLRDLSLSTADVVRVRVQPMQGDDGTISLDDGVALVENARTLVLAAACSTVSPRALFPTRKPADAADYIRRVRLGQTERGSYVVTIVSPVAPQLETPPPGQLFPDTREPFERRVTRKLMVGLAATRKAAHSVITTGTGLDAFRDAVAEGVSANLCDALVGLAGDTARPLTVRMAWSLARPLQAAADAEIAFEPDVLAVVSEASRLLKESAPLDGVTLVGSVTRLDRSQDDGPGEITIMSAIPEVSGNAPRRIRVALNEDAYHQAVVAHDRGQALSVTGDLRKEGRQWWLEQPRDLMVGTDD